MRLYLVRHAEAASGEPDDLRRLTPSGREAARALGVRLAAEGAHPVAVLTSPLLRARETATELCRAFGGAPEPDERLAPGATAEAVRAAVAGRGGEVLVVGHQPDCSRAVAVLIGGDEPAFPPCAYALVELDE